MAQQFTVALEHRHADQGPLLAQVFMQGTETVTGHTGHEMVFHVEVHTVRCKEPALPPGRFHGAGIHARISIVEIGHGGVLCHLADPDDQHKGCQEGTQPDQVYPGNAERCERNEYDQLH